MSKSLVLSRSSCSSSLGFVPTPLLSLGRLSYPRQAYCIRSKENWASGCGLRVPMHFHLHNLNYVPSRSLVASASINTNQDDRQGFSSIKEQTVDYTVLSALASEMQSYLPLKVKEVYQEGDNAVCIQLTRAQGQDDADEEFYLSLNYHKRFARIGFTDSRPLNYLKESAFSQSVAQAINGLRLVSLDVLPFQRIVRLSFSTELNSVEEVLSPALVAAVTSLPSSPDAASQSDGPVEMDAVPAPPPAAQIFLEATGMSVNRLVLLNTKGRVAAAAPAVDNSGAVWGRIGSMYVPPPAGNGSIPSIEEEFEAWEQRLDAYAGSGELVRHAMTRAHVGVSSRLVNQMLSAAGMPLDEALSTLTADDKQRLWRLWRGWLWSLQDRNFAPVVLDGGASFSVLPWPATVAGDDDEPESEESEEADAGLSFETVSACVDWFLRGGEAVELRSALVTQVEQSVQVQRKKLAEFRQKLEEAQEAPRVKLLGELLTANQHDVAPGMSYIRVPDWGAMGEEDAEPPLVEIPLDPQLSGPENAAALFKRFKKLTRQGEAVRALQEQATQALMELVSVREALANVPATGPPAEALERLLALRDDLAGRRVIRSRAGLSADQGQRRAQAQAMVKDQARAGKKPLTARGRDKVPEFYRFTSPSGLDVIAGRSRHENERLTWAVARDRDVWLHARGVGGSHVIVRAPQSGAVPQEDLLFAAGIAAFLSKSKKDTKVDVSYTLKKHLRPPPAKVRRPGMVQITKEEVVTVRPVDVSELIQP